MENKWEKRLRHPIVKTDVRSFRKKKGGVRVGAKVVVRLDNGPSPSKAANKSKNSCDDWKRKKTESGVPKTSVENASKEVQCLACNKSICFDEVLCSVRSCQQPYHLKCAKDKLGFAPPRSFKCPQHVCFVCKRKASWRCIQCTIAAHTKCAPWPERVSFTSQPGQAVCWRHSTGSKSEKKLSAPKRNIEEIFSRLPVPCTTNEFSLGALQKHSANKPKQYVRIKRNVYIAKKKHNFMGGSSGCTACDASGCDVDCVCRVQCISCSKDCACSEMCTNRPFTKKKKVKIARTEHCGWGIEAAEPINTGDLVIEYVGEVIDDAMCKERIDKMNNQGVEQFYLCEIRKDFIIDATSKGNLSRYMNHSCDPNCIMEKWEVDGETRAGIFAIRPIEVGEPITYDYQYVYFGSGNTKCRCGASNCRGSLGAKRKKDKKL